MIAPYKGRFRMTQTYKGGAHDGLDLVGIDSKNIYATVSGVVTHAGWENAANRSQGFGQYVSIETDIDGRPHRAYYGHLSALKVSEGQRVEVGDLIGVEGSTGHSTGSHVHYCIRADGVRGRHIDINAYSGIPNALGTYSSALGGSASSAGDNITMGSRGEHVKRLQEQLIAAGYDCGPAGVDGVCGSATVKAIKAYQTAKGLDVDGIAGPKTKAALDADTAPTETVRKGSEGEHVKRLQELLEAAGYDCGPAGVDGVCGSATVKAIKAYQTDKGLDVDGVCGPKTWAALTK
jgi:peptidoglycan hydrolase-like protein with peptidoglycan-binding domain